MRFAIFDFKTTDKSMQHFYHMIKRLLSIKSRYAAGFQSFEI